MALMFNKAVIIPTGDEVKEEIVLDTDSPMIMQELIKLNGNCNVVRYSPICDKQDEIIECIKKVVHEGSDLIVIIGGSGGGHRYSNTLGKDYTHSSLDLLLEEKYASVIYGKNGHMWSKLLCGKIGTTMIINVPGPYDEAQAAIKSFCASYEKNEDDLKEININMMKAVREQYGH